MLRGFLGTDTPDMHLFQLLRVDRAGGSEHQVLMALRLGKRDDVADVLRAREHHHDPVDARRDPSMWRHAVLEGVEQVTEAFADRLARVAEYLEHALLQGAVVDPDTATTKLVSVAHDVVGIPAAFLGHRAETLAS